MTPVKRIVHATPDQVWAALSDGWVYPVWVVGAARMREVEDDWPAVGSRLHHSFGLWPLMIDDTTEVTRSEPPTLMAMRARGWPMGEAQVTIHLAPVGADTEVTIEEKAVRGPGRLVPSVLQDPPIAWRNTETLRRLALIAEGRR